jgi:hypothetical protein
MILMSTQHLIWWCHLLVLTLIIINSILKVILVKNKIVILTVKSILIKVWSVKLNLRKNRKLYHMFKMQ